MAEMTYGSSAHPPISLQEYNEWAAIITIVEPHEREKARRQRGR